MDKAGENRNQAKNSQRGKGMAMTAALRRAEHIHPPHRKSYPKVLTSTVIEL